MFKVLLSLLMLVFSFKSQALDRYTVANLVKQLKPAVVTVSHKKSLFNSGTGMGSGVVVSSDGYVVTNYHVIAGQKVLNIKFHDKKSYEAEIVSFDKKSDLAILKIKGYNAFPFVYFADSSQAQVGELVFAIGSPYGLEHSVSMGIISGKNRITGNYGYEDFLQTDASINPGNSGGPLFNLSGQLLGINTAAVRPNGNATGIGFAIPSNLVKKIISDLKTKGETSLAGIGAKYTDIDYNIQEQLSLSYLSGAVVYKITSNVAFQSGLKVGDVIIAFNGKNINKAADLKRQLSFAKIGTKARIQILRNNKKRTLVVRIEKIK